MPRYLAFKFDYIAALREVSYLHRPAQAMKLICLAIRLELAMGYSCRCSDDMLFILFKIDLPYFP